MAGRVEEIGFEVKHILSRRVRHVRVKYPWLVDVRKGSRKGIVIEVHGILQNVSASSLGRIGACVVE